MQRLQVLLVVLLLLLLLLLRCGLCLLRLALGCWVLLVPMVVPMQVVVPMPLQLLLCELLIC
jgi:hypothetical protein